ncbi:MAG: hypothetical protein FJ388_08005, partial [Verrucomicrobia bacterium]|nr:hypothetical protein [Verrucomicrobiota bacterium]
RLAWYALTLAWLGLAFVINSDHADHWVRQSLRMGMVERRLNPVVTLVASLKESWLVEPIAPCLATSELAPIGSGWQVPASATNRPSVILLSVEALRHDVVLLRHQGQEIMPHLNALARRGLHFTRAYSQSSQTDYAAACVPSSLYPLRERWHHYYRPDDPWPVTRLYDLLKPAGYATAMFSAEDEIWGGLSSFWQTPNLDLFWDACREAAQTNVLAATPMAWEERFLKRGVFGVSDDCIATRAIRWMRQRGPQPFYLGLYFGSSHFPYTLEASCPRPFQPCAIDFDVSFLRYPREKAEVMRNAYFNALREADRQIGRLVGALREMGRLDNTILLVCGDHGESFHENNSVVHAREPFEPSLRIACVLHAPALVQPRREDYPVEAVDFAPTLLGLMGRPRHPNHQGINVLASDRPPLSERALFFHTENPFTRTDAVLLAGRWKFWLDRAHQREALYDLASRPGEMEADNVAAHEPALTARLRALLLSWRARQLAYYAHPFYYRNFYPPRPPGLSLITHHSSKP